MKKVLLFIVDALSSRHVQHALTHDRLPNLANLIDRGMMHPECLSIFPSITPAATASILTGQYPNEHGIPGAFYYEPEKESVRYFGADIWIVLREGFAEFFNDFLVHLNEDHLSAETLFETVERNGKKAACLNYLIFRGDQAHQVDVPWLLKFWPGVPFREEVHGPSILCLGDLVRHQPREEDPDLSASGGPFRKYGFKDASTAEFLLELMEEKSVPDFTLAYFPDNDFNSHSDGPASSVETLEAFDKHLGSFVDAAGGWEPFLQDYAVLISGDHSQSDLASDESARGIELDDVLTGFTVVPPGETWDSQTDLMVCMNMRATQIYLNKKHPDQQLGELTKALLSDYRIDQVISRESRETEEGPWTVVTADRGRLKFWSDSSDSAMALDQFGNGWSWDGDLTTFDAHVTDERVIEFGDYPNAFDRISGCFCTPGGGDIWVTARIGYEFAANGSRVHACGSHGSLHRDDSVSPLIVAGLDAMPDGARPVRTIDLFGMCCRELGIGSD